MSWTRKEDTQLYRVSISFACFSHPMLNWEKVKKKLSTCLLFIETKVTEALLEALMWDFERKVTEASSSFSIVAYL